MKEQTTQDAIPKMDSVSNVVDGDTPQGTAPKTQSIFNVEFGNMTPKFKMNIIKTVGILGDSIARGVIWDEIAGKYKLLKESAATLFGSSNQIFVKNYSKFGCTTQKALQLLPDILQKEASGEIVLLELGGNDCDFDWESVLQEPLSMQHVPNVPFADFKKNISSIIEQILSTGKRPVVMTLPPIDAEKYFNWIVRGCTERAQKLLAYLGDKSLIYRHQELYANALEKIAMTYNLSIVPVREALLQLHKYSDYLCLDGIHLNSKGHAFMKSVCDHTYNEYLQMRAV